MIVKAVRRVAVPPGLVIEPGQLATCTDAAAYEFVAHGAVLVGLRARVLRDGTVIGNTMCNAGDVVDLSVFSDLGSIASARIQTDVHVRLSTSFEPTIGVVPLGESDPVEAPVMDAVGLVSSGRARYAEPAKVAEVS